MKTPDWLDDIHACVFDAYGTVFDFNSAAQACREELGAAFDAVANVWRVKQLEYSWLRALSDSYAPFFEVTDDALEYALKANGLKGDAGREIRRRMLDLYRTSAAYPAVSKVLKTIRASGRGVAILSNGSPQMLADAVEHAELGGALDVVLSADAAKTFKPHPAIYQLASDHFSVEPERLLFVSGNSWDAFGAKRFGLRVAWLNRAKGVFDSLPAQPDIELGSLHELEELFSGQTG